MTKRPRPSKSRLAWLALGLETLRNEGDGALTVDGLCRRLGKTKGSFYHHFADREDFVAQLLGHWRERFTDQFIDDLASLDDPRDRLRGLADRTVREVDLRLERAIRFWADREPIAHGILTEVDRAREAYLREQFLAATGDEARADVAARAHMAALVGTQVLYQDLPRETAHALALFIDVLGLRYRTKGEEAP